MDDVKVIAKDILEKGFLMTLATHDDSGVWACDLVYTSGDDLTIYWISHETVRHSQAIVKNPQVSATISLEKDFSGVQLAGYAEKVTEPNADVIKRIKAKQGKESDALGSGEVLYKITPQMIEVIDVKRFGFDKKIIEI